MVAGRWFWSGRQKISTPKSTISLLAETIVKRMGYGTTFYEMQKREQMEWS